MDEMLKKQDVLDAIYATMEKTDKPDVVLGLAAAMSTVKQMQGASVNPAEKQEPSYNSVKIELKPCDDCISRQAVLDAISNEKYHYWALFEYVKQLPPVNPTEKVGQWEWNQYDSNPKIGNFHCSQCHGIGKAYYDYCPYCGSRMTQEVEE